MKANELNSGERYFKEKRTAIFRKEKYEYIHTGIIDQNGETWTTTELDEENLNQVYNQYRERHGIPFPDEIRSLRKRYGLSAAKMSLILGFGTNQYRLYEEGEVPSISNARMMMATRDKNMFATFLEASRNELTTSEYNKVKKRLRELKEYNEEVTVTTLVSEPPAPDLRATESES